VPSEGPATIDDYDDGVTATLLGIAADVFRSFGGGFGHVVLIGGVVPTLMSPASLPEGVRPHAGTSDLDLHLSLELMDGDAADYYESIVDGFDKLGLKPSKMEAGRTTGWRWEGTLRGIHVLVDLLCPVRTKVAGPEAAAGATTAEANVGMPDQIKVHPIDLGHLVSVDHTTIDRRVPTAQGEMTYSFPVAGAASWLCLKSDAIKQRAKAKDAYDVVWLITALGADVVADLVAGSELLQSEHGDEAMTQLRLLVLDQFADLTSVGPRSYALFLNAPDDERLLRDAHGALAAFHRELRDREIDVG
jgi:hypothetical protein